MSWLASTRVEPARQGPPVVLSSGYEGVHDVEDPVSDQRYRIQVPRSDIDTCIRFSTWRCIVTIIGVALVLTDIPRTGLSLSIEKMYPRVGPGMYSSYGPFTYPTIFINRSSASAYQGFRKGTPMAAANVWAFKFDTLTIAQRAIAEHLQVATYPDCILYREPCPETTLSLATAFNMIDGSVSEMCSTYFSDSGLPFVFLTRSNWVDRLHNVLVRPAWRRQETRIHTVRYYSAEATSTSKSPWRLCNQLSKSRNRRLLRAYVCDLAVKWRFSHPLPPKPAVKPSTVSIPMHIELRLRAFQRQYPDLQVDLTMITSRRVLSGEPLTSTLPIVFYTSENIDVITWMRGQRCAAGSDGVRKCETVFVDDYRYEGATLATNADEWRMVTSALRAFAQGYIWIRLALLCVGAFRARSSEFKFQRRPLWHCLMATLATLGRIPSHSVIYGSWLPICCYASAHVIDSSLTHLISNNVWSTIDGLFTFQFVDYISSATVQMRNVWMFALVGKIAMVFYTNAHGKSRGDTWAPTNGVLAVRGIFVSFISWLTVFSFLRALRFRDTNIIEFIALPRHVPLNGLRSPMFFNNVSDFGYRLDVKTGCVGMLLVGIQTQLLQAIVFRLTNRRTRYMYCRSHYVPLSADKLWSPTMLNMFWNLRLNKSGDRTASIPTISRTRIASMQSLKALSALALENTVFPMTPSPHVQCSVCNRAMSLVHWRSVQGCVRHDNLFRVETRPPEVWSMVRLANLTMLSDPIVLIQMYVFGTELHLCRLQDRSASQLPRRDDSQQPAILLPTLLLETTRLEVFASVNSRAVPWKLLVNCG